MTVVCEVGVQGFCDDSITSTKKRDGWERGLTII